MEERGLLLHCLCRPALGCQQDLVEITRGQFLEAKGDLEWPDAIEYLSVQCYILPLVLSSQSEAQQVPVLGFLQTADTNWNSLWEPWLPYFAWCPVL